jgi:hypothetical protein
VLVDLPSGGDALLLAESMVVSDFIFAIDDVDNGQIKTQGRVIDEITGDQHKYYGLDNAAFPEPTEDGRVMLLLSIP